MAKTFQLNGTDFTEKGLAEHVEAAKSALAAVLVDKLGDPQGSMSFAVSMTVLQSVMATLIVDRCEQQIDERAKTHDLKGMAAIDAKLMMLDFYVGKNASELPKLVTAELEKRLSPEQAAFANMLHKLFGGVL